MVERADDTGIQFTVGHQRQFTIPVIEAYRWFHDGQIGSLERVEFSAWNLFDSGSHMVNLYNYFTGTIPVE